MRSLALFVSRHRWLVIGAWIVLTLVGALTAGRLSDRWYQGSAVPGAPAYESGQRALATFGAGARSPNVIVVHGDTGALRGALQRSVATLPGALAGAEHVSGRTA